MTSYHQAILAVVLAQFTSKAFADGIGGVMKLMHASPYLQVLLLYMCPSSYSGTSPKSGLRCFVYHGHFATNAQRACWLDFVTTPSGLGTEWANRTGPGGCHSFASLCVFQAHVVLSPARCMLGMLMLMLFVLELNVGCASIYFST